MICKSLFGWLGRLRDPIAWRDRALDLLYAERDQLREDLGIARRWLDAVLDREGHALVYDADRCAWGVRAIKDVADPRQAEIVCHGPAAESRAWTIATYLNGGECRERCHQRLLIDRLRGLLRDRDDEIADLARLLKAAEADRDDLWARLTGDDAPDLSCCPGGGGCALDTFKDS